MSVSQITQYPFYYAPRSRLVPMLSDAKLGLSSGMLTYWLASLLFHTLDTLSKDRPWLRRYRSLDQDAENPEGNDSKRARVSKPEVVVTVMSRQLFAMLLGLLLLDDSEETWQMSVHQRALRKVASQITQLMGSSTHAETFVASFGPSLSYLTYWYLKPVGQFCLAM